MKQEVPTSEGKSSSLQHSPMPVARARVPRTKESSRLGSPNGVSKASPKTPPKEANNSSRIRRPIDLANDQKGVDQPRTRAVDQCARVRRHSDMNCKGLGNQNDGKLKDDLERRLNVSDSLVNELRSEVSALKAQMEKLHSRNVLLESQNKQLGRDLSLAEAKILALEKKDEAESTSKEFHPSEFKDVREIIANKLDLLSAKKEVTKESKPAKLQSLALEPGVKSVGNRLKVQLPVPPPPPSRASPVAGPPPPPPPPPPRNALARANIMQKPTTFVDFYHSITKRDGKNGNMQSENCASPLANKAHNSIVDELQNRSSHLLAIKADVEKKSDFINHLIQKVQSAAFTDIEDVTKFVDWLDGQLSILADERAVLKHFNWPERKADALREAAFEYRDLKKLLIEVSSLENGTSLPCDAILKKITTLQDKSERSIQRLIKFRDTTMVSYRDFKIPTEWMLDSGIICKIKMGSVKLAKIYIKRVSTELESVRNTERESIQEVLLLQGVRFAYRAYQFAGGLDSDTMRAFEELRERVQSHRRGSFMV